jgi:putative oxidoreductase
MNPSVMLSVLRIVAGLLFLEHGTSKVLGFPASPMHAAAPHVMPHYMQVLAAISGPMELIGGALITLGLLTRPVAFLLSGEMAVAYFTATRARRRFFSASFSSTSSSPARGWSVSTRCCGGSDSARSLRFF